jgi:hypothetical protein
VDKLGGPVDGSWTAGTPSGPFTIAKDDEYRPVSSGPLKTVERFVLSASDAGDGSVTITGTGGTITIPVRIAPDSGDLAMTFTSPTEVGGVVTVPLNSSVTATLPAGTRFTANSGVTMYTGPLARDTSIFRPLNVSISADSQSITWTPGPNSNGQARLTGIASVSTPTLSVSARTRAVFSTDQFDTAGTTRLAATAAPAIGDTITVTVPADYALSPTSTAAFYTEGVASNGLGTPAVIDVSADSSTMHVLPAPGAKGQLRITGIRVRANPVWVFAAKTDSAASAQYNVPTITEVAATVPATAAENTAITITMPAGTKLRPTSSVTTVGAPAASGATALPAIVVSRAADSSSITVIPMPGFKRPFQITALQDTRVAALSLSLPTSDSVQTTAVAGDAVDTIPSLGDDDASSGPVGQVTINLAVGETGGFWDRGTWESPDWVGFGGPEQDIAVDLTNAGNYTVTMDWDGGSGSDIDFVLFNSTLDGLIGGFGAATGNHPEQITANFPAGVFYITSGVYNGTNPKSLKITIKRNS